MSSKKKGSLLNGVLGKGKDDEDGGAPKPKKGKKNKLEKQPSIRESVHSGRAPTMHSVTHHGSEAQLHYEDHHYGVPVTAVHEQDPYDPFDEGESYTHMREPSNIQVHPESSVHHNSVGYFEQPFSQSPRGTVVHSGGVHENSVEHVETAHPNVINLGGQGHGYAQPDEHVAFAGVSRQPTILSPHHQSSDTPRMLKPGDQMEIDPRNPPTFVVDEGVTLEIGDDEHGFVPYEQYLANLAKQPPPTTGGTYIVQGGGDVVIQDENGNVIKTIPGTGANAGKGEAQIHLVNGSTIPPHIVPILVSLSRRAAKPRYLIQSKQRNNQRQLHAIKAPVKFSAYGLDSILEPTSAPNAFSSLFDLVDPLPRREAASEVKNPNEGVVIGSSAPEMAALEEKPPIPTRPIPQTPTTAALDLESSAESHQLGQAMPTAEIYDEPPMASAASIEDFDELEDVDSDLALMGGTSDVAKTPKMSPGRAMTLVTTTFSRVIEGPSPATPIEELSDMSEIILSPARTRSMASNATSSQSSPSRSDDLDQPQEALPAPWAAGGPRLYGFQGDFAIPAAPVVRERTTSGERNVVTAPARQASPTLTHSQVDDVDEEREMPYSRPSPPPRPARSPDRPSPSSSRKDSLGSVPPLPLPPPLAILRQAHRNPIPIPSSTLPPEKSTQPRLNPSPKILAMIQKFEGTSRETEDLGNVFIGSTRSLSVSPSRRGSDSSVSKMEYNYSSPWTSYNTPPSSRPDTPNSVSEFGEQMYPDNRPSNMEIARGVEVRWRGDGRTSDMVNQAHWDLRPTTTRRGSMPKTSRPSMTPAIPGWEVQPELIRELSQKRLRRAE